MLWQEFLKVSIHLQFQQVRAVLRQAFLNNWKYSKLKTLVIDVNTYCYMNNTENHS